MTRAEGAWRQAAGGLPSTLDPLTVQPVVDAELDHLAAATRSEELSSADQARYSRSSPRSGRRSTPGSPRPARSLQGLSAGSAASASERAGPAAAYDRFLSTNESLGSSIQTQRDAARIDSREATTITSGVIIAVAAAVVLVLVAAGFGMDRAVGRPLARLREVVRRQAEEDVITMANQEEGAFEVRMLARDFNDLTRANARLVDQQAAVLEMQELVLDVGRTVRSAVDVHEALQRVTTKLGAGLGADRVLLYTLADDGQTIEDRLQWHTADLPDLPPLPRSLAQQVGCRQRRAAPRRRLLRHR